VVKYGNVYMKYSHLPLGELVHQGSLASNVLAEIMSDSAIISLQACKPMAPKGS